MSTRLAAALALASWVVLILVAFAFLFDRPLELVIALVGTLLALLGAWWIATERQWRRWVGLAATIAAFGAVLWTIIATDEDRSGRAVQALVMVALLIAFNLLGRYAVRAVAGPVDVADHPAIRPEHPVMIGNPWSGGGKVDSFGLKDLAAELGVEVVMLADGLDLEELARDAVDRGADAIGMAGGDGSQALVASIAVEHDIPYVCIPAGTRNHLALDLGLDRDDPRLAMVAFTEGVERRIDYGTVNGRLFVNNVSLGVYAEVVQQDSYRDAKAETTLDLLPDMLGRQAEPFDLQLTLPDGTEVDGAYLIQISNNPYQDSSLLQFGERPRIDTGQLGAIALWEGSDVTLPEIVAAAATRRLDQTGALAEVKCTTIEVRSRSGTAYAGVDGEALELETPMDFRIHPLGLRLLVPPDNIEAAHERATGDVTLNRLWQIARGASS